MYGQEKGQTVRVLHRNWRTAPIPTTDRRLAIAIDGRSCSITCVPVKRPGVLEFVWGGRVPKEGRSFWGKLNSGQLSERGRQEKLQQLIISPSTRIILSRSSLFSPAPDCSSSASSSSSPHSLVPFLILVATSRFPPAHLPSNMRVTSLLAVAATAAIARADVLEDAGNVVKEATSSVVSAVKSATESLVEKPTFTVSISPLIHVTAIKQRTNSPPARHQHQSPLLRAVSRRLKMAAVHRQEGEHRGGVAIRWHLECRGAQRAPWH